MANDAQSPDVAAEPGRNGSNHRADAAITPVEADNGVPEEAAESEDPAATAKGAALEAAIADVGQDLARTMSTVLGALPGAPYGTISLARTLGIDKVLSSRVLKATRTSDPLAVAHLMPGPEPLRRVLKAASKKQIGPDLINEADAAVSRFEHLIRVEVGDRSALDALISAWLPEARAQFEVRRKQSAFKAMSQIKGAMAEVNLSTVLLNPSGDGAHLDVVWVFGLLGLRRLRPGAPIKFATRRMAEGADPRTPCTLRGEPVDGLGGLRLDSFCSTPTPELAVHRAGEVVHYTLAGDDFGPRSGVDLILGEANFAELDRYVPRERNRRANVFAEVGTPANLLQFDVIVHKGVYPGSEPELIIYDTVLDGVANVNDRSRDLDRFDMHESVQLLGRGLSRLNSPHVSRYGELMSFAFQSLGWRPEEFRGYRCIIDYPIYGSQVLMAFRPPAPPDT